MKEFFKQKNKFINGRQTLSEAKGFTLVETLVALSIFTMSILALLSILGQGISDTSYSKKKIIASYLAQEGIEYMRNLRDTYVLYNPEDSAAGWAEFLSRLAAESCQTGDGCYFDDQVLDYGDTSQPILDIELNDCDSSCPELRFDKEEGSYGYSGEEESGFFRRINTEEIGDADNNVIAVKIFSTVDWTQGSRGYSLTLSEDLYNWME